LSGLPAPSGVHVIVTSIKCVAAVRRYSDQSLLPRPDQQRGSELQDFKQLLSAPGCLRPALPQADAEASHHPHPPLPRRLRKHGSGRSARDAFSKFNAICFVSNL